MTDNDITHTIMPFAWKALGATVAKREYSHKLVIMLHATCTSWVGDGRKLWPMALEVSGKVVKLGWRGLWVRWGVQTLRHLIADTRCARWNSKLLTQAPSAGP